ncbi:ABC-type transport system involved in cytochrome c biogenesis permease subunit [Rhizobium sp. BK512]|nr:ABC-type transport system involved in cytochrome c biogenesis permease subunit [Rhizobium sp. BK512]
MTYVERIKDDITRLAQPARFLELADRVLTGLSIVTALCFAVGLYLSFVSDGDYQQGETVRIMYVHVPAAWMAMFCYVVMTANAIGSLVWRHPLADVAARAAVPIGAAFTFVSLVTGAIWASRCGEPGGCGTRA